MENYNFYQRFLHDLVLGNNFIKKSLYELEKVIYLKKNNFIDKKHIFITGLPRSGTTTLLNFIYSSNSFASLKYFNMPFILSPNISKILKRKNIALKERFHEDGIMFDLKTPEAFDEAFFSMLDEKSIKNELLNYINLILLSENKTKYLSKNNLNYKRINIIQSILPNSLFIIPIREPIQHSYSLLNQHLHFLKLHKQQDFIRRYMNYLGHNEFGVDHIPWNKSQKYYDPMKINYWLEQWILFYEKIYNNYKNNSNCKFITYEKLVDKKVIKDLINFLNIEVSNDFIFKCNNKKNIDITYDHEIYKRAYNTYIKFNVK
tara:strand:- start:601 stop:1554 length:954 start_codon:yes stop_codon:yes gene_type:complete